jgi:hypothetical protein
MKSVLYVKQQLLYDELSLRNWMKFNSRFMQNRGILHPHEPKLN